MVQCSTAQTTMGKEEIMMNTSYVEKLGSITKAWQLLVSMYNTVRLIEPS